jgi:hypothetical protein
MEALRNPDAVRWSTPETVRARFILSRNADLSGPRVMDIQNPGTTLQLYRLPEGRYYWTVQAMTLDGFDISPERVSSFTVLPIPPLGEAAGRTPANGFRLGPEYLRANRSITFNWQSVPEANGYIFTLFHEDLGNRGSRRVIISSDPSDETLFTLDDLAVLSDQGNFIWQVEAVFVENDIIIRRGILGINRFTVDVPEAGRAGTRIPGTLYGHEE